MSHVTQEAQGPARLCQAEGAASALVLGGGQDEESAPLGVAGVWEGTRIINNVPLFENCTRVR